MTRARHNLSGALEEILVGANAATTRRDAESAAIKVAEALPKTETARMLKTLASNVRNASDDVSYADIARPS